MNVDINILIAEDEPNIATALKFIVNKAVQDAYVEVVGNGRDALNATMERPYNLIISDWNMPGLTGIDLLTELRKNESTRDIPFLMLTARGDKESVIEAVQGGVTDYVAKPFENKNIINKIHTLLSPPETQPEEVAEVTIESLSLKLHSGDIDFPVFPVIGMKAVELTKRDNFMIKDLSKLVQQDPVLTSRLLVIANSSYYGAARKIDSVENAIVRIGLRDTSNIILAISNRALYKKTPGIIGDRLNALWIHSFATGACARIISTKLQMLYPDRAFAMGLLHDVGKLVLLTILGALPAKRDISAVALDELLTSLHVEFGKVLITHWNMPVEFADAVINHHNLQGMKNFHVSTQVVAMANLLVRRLGMSLIPDEGIDLANTELASLLQLTDGMLDDILVSTEAYIQEFGNIL